MRRALLCLALAACGSDKDKVSASAPRDAAPLFGESTAPSTPKDEARRIWDSACKNCHGPGGRGDGSLASGLKPPPRDHSDPAWQDATSDETIAKVITEGGPAVGKSSLMPGRPDLADRPEVLKEMVALIRSFRR
jgi:mono/diheme cytochrome c family protein